MTARVVIEFACDHCSIACVQPLPPESAIADVMDALVAGVCPRGWSWRDGRLYCPWHKPDGEP